MVSCIFGKILRFIQLAIYKGDISMVVKLGETPVVSSIVTQIFSFIQLAIYEGGISMMTKLGRKSSSKLYSQHCHKEGQTACSFLQGNISQCPKKTMSYAAKTLVRPLVEYATVICLQKPTYGNWKWCQTT